MERVSGGGEGINAHKSRIAKWCKLMMTIRPEPQPIQTGATVYSLAVSFGILACYKLHARMFGGRSDGDLGMRHENCETIQKWINLMSKMIDEYKGEGR